MTKTSGPRRGPFAAVAARPTHSGDLPLTEPLVTRWVDRADSSDARFAGSVENRFAAMLRQVKQTPVPLEAQARVRIWRRLTARPVTAGGVISLRWIVVSLSILLTSGVVGAVGIARGWHPALGRRFHAVVAAVSPERGAHRQRSVSVPPPPAPKLQVAPPSAPAAPAPAVSPLASPALASPALAPPALASPVSPARFDRGPRPPGFGARVDPPRDAVKTVDAAITARRRMPPTSAPLYQPLAPSPAVGPSQLPPPARPRSSVEQASSPLAPTPEPPRATSLALESDSLRRALVRLRYQHDARGALDELDRYSARFPAGILRREADAGRVDALLMLGRKEDALRVLEGLVLSGEGRGRELTLIRGELRAARDCGGAAADFTSVLRSPPPVPPELAERAFRGRSECRQRLGDPTGAREDRLKSSTLPSRGGEIEP